MVLPATMKALVYRQQGEFQVERLPLPTLRDDDILVKVTVCGVCSTDLTMHNGGFIARYPLTPGHEAVGVVAAVGAAVRGVEVGDRVVTDNTEFCGHCFHCRRGESLLCADFGAHGATLPGGLAEFCAYPAKNVFKLPDNVADLDATLVEAASCVAHGVSRLGPQIGSSALVLGAGPTGLLMAQLLRLNGCSSVTIAAPEGQKMSMARSLDVADQFISLYRGDSLRQLREIRAGRPNGFDVVVEATGIAEVLEASIELVGRGGKLLVYGVYANDARVSWSPMRILADEIAVIGSFCEAYMFPAALGYFERGTVKVAGIVNKTYHLEQWEECLQSLRDKSITKAAIVFPGALVSQIES